MTDTTARSAGPAEAVHIVVDGRPVEAAPGELIIEAAERAGVYIPRFCYHPRMGPVGMCRMCLVELSGPRGFSLQPACFISVAEGQEIVTTSAKARKAQEGVLEFLLVNHPLDCPVCDKGGECPLQDQALSHGPGESRFIEEKRHWDKPIEIGPLVYLDRERCIQCARCTRFADEIAGEALINFAFRGASIEVATFPTEPFTSYFSGNTVQICPVGALTAPPYRFKSRPWDLEQVETTCTTCSVGCRVVAQSSAGTLVRYLGVDSEPVNQSWLCDKGRYGFEAVNSPARFTQPLVRKDGDLKASKWFEAIGEVAAGARQALASDSAHSIGVIGGARLANEDAYAWAKLARTVLATDDVDAQLGDGLPAELVLGLPRATIDQASSAKVLILITGDVREELPVLYLRLRDAAKRGVQIIECSPIATSLSPLAAVRLTHTPGGVARLVSALLSSDAPGDVEGVEASQMSAARAMIRGAASEGAEPGAGVVAVIGRPSLASSSAPVVTAAGLLHASLPGARFLPALRRANVLGALDMGLAPGVLPGRVSLEAARIWYSEAWGAQLPAERGLDTAGILAAAASGELQMLVLLGADPLSDFPDRGLATTALGTVPLLVSVGTHPDASSELSHVVLPVAGDGERAGTTTNLEGRVSRLAAKVSSPGISWPAWMVAAELARRLGGDLGFENIEAISEEIERLAPAYRGVTADILARPAGRDGLVVPVAAVTVSIGRRTHARPIDPMATPGIASVEEQGAPLRVGAATPLGGDALRDDELRTDPAVRPALLEAPLVADMPEIGELEQGRHRLVIRRALYDAGTLVGASPSLAPLAPAPALRMHPGELARLGIAAGAAVSVRSVQGEIVLPVVGDAGVGPGVVVLDANLPARTALIAGVAPVPADRPGDGRGTGAVEHGLTPSGLVSIGAMVTDVKVQLVDAGVEQS